MLLHGFTDAPTQFATVGAHFFADGANVYIPRLPHHAERISPLRAISRVRSDELARFADSTVEIARGLGDTIVVVGLSAGGVLAGWIAEFHPEVQRAVLIAPAIGPGGVADDDAGGLVILASKLPDIERRTAPIDTGRPENVPGITTRGLAELLRLGRRVHDQAESGPPAVRDIVFLLNERDRTVSENASLDLAQRWMDRGAGVRTYRFTASTNLPHNVMELTVARRQHQPRLSRRRGAGTWTECRAAGHGAVARRALRGVPVPASTIGGSAVTLSTDGVFEPS